jgi:ketosteroid isomerase-like protein
VKHALLVVLAALVPVAALAQPLPAVELPPEIDRVLKDYARAWAANDPDALARLFAPDGMALPNGQPPARGADSIRKAYAQGAGMPLFLRPVAFATSGDLAYVIGGFGPAADAPEPGKFTLILRRDAGDRWLIVSDMDNSNLPMRPAAPPQPAPAGD